MKRIVIHCSATREDSKYTVEQLDKDHRRRGFNGAGYNYYIERDGTVHQLRAIGAILAHAKCFNRDSIAICYEGGLNSNNKAKDTRTRKQKQALINCILFFRSLFPNAELMGHRDLSPDLNGDGVISKEEYMKECPCFDVKKEYFLYKI